MKELKSLFCFLALQFAYAVDGFETHFPSAEEIESFKGRNVNLIFGAINTELPGKLGEEAKNWIACSDSYASYGNRYGDQSDYQHRYTLYKSKF